MSGAPVPEWMMWVISPVGLVLAASVFLTVSIGTMWLLVRWIRRHWR